MIPVIKKKNVFGIFSESSLEQVLRDLDQFNLPSSEISVLVPEGTDNSMIRVQAHDKINQGLLVGEVCDGLVGVISKGFSFRESILAPGKGIFVAGPLIDNPLVGALAANAAGARAGILIGALIGAGIPEKEAYLYEDALRKEGNVMVILRVSETVLEQIKDVFDCNGVRALYPELK